MRVDRASRDAIQRRRHAWARFSAENAAEAAERFREIAARLPLRKDQVRPFIDAAMAATRFYAMEFGFANHELRTGKAFPAEAREAEEALLRSQWAEALARLERHP